MAGLVAKTPGVTIDSVACGPFVVFVWQAPVGEYFDLHIETAHTDEYHATLSFMVGGRVNRFNRDAPADSFIYNASNASRDIGPRVPGFFRHEFLEPDSRFYQVKLVRPRPLDDAFTTQPICERINVKDGEVWELQPHDMIIPVSGLITVNSQVVPNGEVIYADRLANIRGRGVVEYFHA